MILEEKELETLTGGGWAILACIGAIGVLIVGIVDGFVRPLKCN